LRWTGLDGAHHHIKLCGEITGFEQCMPAYFGLAFVIVLVVV
jgi:hypothetical protein